MRRIALLLVFLVGALAVAAPAVAGCRYVIRGDSSLAGFHVKTTNSVADAVKVFGAPAARRYDNTASGCLLRWRIGLQIWFGNLGGNDPCGAHSGFFTEARATGAGWCTSLGLRIGDSAWQLRRRYPNASYDPHTSSWWLLTRWSAVGSTDSYAALTATVAHGRVVRFTVRYAGAGD
jgi:hypothetical protein